MSSNAVADPPSRVPAREAWPRRLDAARAQLPSWWSVIGLALLLMLGAALMAYEARGTIFGDDEWIWILGRRGGGISTLLDPHNSHLSLIPIAIYKLLFATAGLRHYWPYRAVGIGAHLLCVALVYEYVRRRLGGYLGLLAAALILLFGPGWQNILWPFQMAWLLAICGGVAALLALERRDSWGDVSACLLLTLAVCCAGPGVAVAIGVLIEVAWRRPRTDWWIAVVPLGLYVLWSLGYQDATVNRHAIVLLPRFVFNAAAGAVSALVGLSADDISNNASSFLPWGAPLLLASLAALVWRVRRLPPPPPRLLVLLAILLAFWVLTGLGRAYATFGNYALVSTGDESRYLYVSAVFILLVAAEALRGWRPGLFAGAVLGVLTIAAAVSNLGPLQDGARLLRKGSQQRLASLSALQLSRTIVSPGYVSNGFIFGVVNARGLFVAEDALGSPLHAPPTAVLAGLPAAARFSGDSELIGIQSLRLVQAPAAAATAPVPALDGTQLGRVTTRAGCQVFRPEAVTTPGGGSAVELTVPSSGLLVHGGAAPATVAVRRFGDTFQTIGALNSGGTGIVRPRVDLARVPWHAQIQTAAPLMACGLA